MGKTKAYIRNYGVVCEGLDCGYVQGVRERKGSDRERLREAFEEQLMQS